MCMSKAKLDARPQPCDRFYINIPIWAFLDKNTIASRIAPHQLAIQKSKYHKIQTQNPYSWLKEYFSLEQTASWAPTSSNNSSHAAFQSEQSSDLNRKLLKFFLIFPISVASSTLALCLTWRPLALSTKWCNLPHPSIRSSTPRHPSYVCDKHSPKVLRGSLICS